MRNQERKFALFLDLAVLLCFFDLLFFSFDLLILNIGLSFFWRGCGVLLLVLLSLKDMFGGYIADFKYFLALISVC